MDCFETQIRFPKKQTALELDDILDRFDKQVDEKDYLNSGLKKIIIQRIRFRMM